MEDELTPTDSQISSVTQCFSRANELVVLSTTIQLRRKTRYGDKERRLAVHFKR